MAQNMKNKDQERGYIIWIEWKLQRKEKKK